MVSFALMRSILSTLILIPFLLVASCKAKETQTQGLAESNFTGSGFLSTITPLVESELEAFSSHKASLGTPAPAALTKEEVLQKLETLGKTLHEKLKSGGIEKSKAALEAILWPNKKIAYNQKFSSVIDFLSEPKLQCRSGSLVYALGLFSSFANQTEYDAVHPVFIFEAGHILPGLMKREKNDWRLMGIEMTAAGEGLRDYGLTRELSGSMRVSDMKSYLDLFQNDAALKKDLEARYRAEDRVLAETAKEYAVPLETLEKSIKEEYPDARDGKTSFSDYLQFGVVDVPEGDQERKEVPKTKEGRKGYTVVSISNSNEEREERIVPHPGGGWEIVPNLRDDIQSDRDRVVLKDYGVKAGDRIFVNASRVRLVNKACVNAPCTFGLTGVEIKLDGVTLGRGSQAEYQVDHSGKIEVAIEVAIEVREGKSPKFLWQGRAHPLITIHRNTIEGFGARGDLSSEAPAGTQNDP